MLLVDIYLHTQVSANLQENQFIVDVISFHSIVFTSKVTITVYNNLNNSILTVSSKKVSLGILYTGIHPKNLFNTNIIILYSVFKFHHKGLLAINWYNYCIFNIIVLVNFSSSRHKYSLSVYQFHSTQLCKQLTQVGFLFQMLIMLRYCNVYMFNSGCLYF